MTKLFVGLLLILSCTVVSASNTYPELEKRIDTFFGPLKAEFAHLSLDQSWKSLEISGKEAEANELRGLLKNRGPIRKVELYSSREGAGARLVRLTYRLKFKTGDAAEIEFSYMKKIDSPYRVYDIKINR